MNVLTGESESAAVSVTVSVPPTPMSCGPICGKIGAPLVLETIRLKDCVTLRLGEPLSKIRITTGLVEFPCASVGVHVKKPLVRFTKALEGPEINKNKIRSPSGSVAPFGR